MTDTQILESIEEIGLWKTIKNNNIENRFFIDNHESINFELLFKFIEADEYKISEDFIGNLIYKNIIGSDKIFDLPMSFYTIISKEFIQKYKENINWKRMFLYLLSDKNIDIWEYEDIINEYNLWDLASTIELPKDFIDKYSDKLNWEYLCMVNEFDEDFVEKYPDALYYVTISERRNTINNS